MDGNVRTLGWMNGLSLTDGQMDEEKSGWRLDEQMDAQTDGQPDRQARQMDGQDRWTIGRPDGQTTQPTARQTGRLPQIEECMDAGTDRTTNLWMTGHTRMGRPVG